MGSPPTPTPRPAFAGQKIGDGFGALITIAADTDIEFDETSVTPPSIELDAAIDTSSHHNVKWRTFHPGKLAKLGMIAVNAGYDPLVYPSIVAIIGTQTTITVKWPNGDTLALYGYIASAKPGPLEANKKPEIAIEIQPTNADPVDCTEEGPVYTAGVGTGCF